MKFEFGKYGFTIDDKSVASYEMKGYYASMLNFILLNINLKYCNDNKYLIHYTTMQIPYTLHIFYSPNHRVTEDFSNILNYTYSVSDFGKTVLSSSYTKPILY